MHMMSTKDFTTDEMDTLRRSNNPIVVLTAFGEVRTEEEQHRHCRICDQQVHLNSEATN